MLSLFNPHNELFRVSRDLDDWFNWPAPQKRRVLFTPAVDIQELEDSFILKADLPGLKRDEIEVRIEGDTLTIAGQREVEKEEGKNGVYRRERSSGAFSRRFNLGPEVAAGEIDAGYENGVLTLKLPKAEQAKPQKIAVH